MILFMMANESDGWYLVSQGTALTVNGSKPEKWRSDLPLAPSFCEDDLGVDDEAYANDFAVYCTEHSITHIIDPEAAPEADTEHQFTVHEWLKANGFA